MPIVVDGPVNETRYFIDVPSAGTKAGCGVEGATVTFAVNGRSARQTGVWHAGTSRQLDIWAGEDFAAFSGGLSINGQPVSLTPDLPVVKAFVGGVECGERRVSPGFAPGATSVPLYVLLIVLSDASRAGCGREGAAVTFTINGVPADQTATWSSGFHTLDLNARVQLPPTGGRPGEGDDGWWPVLAGVMIVVFGLAGITVAVRRRGR